MPVDWGQLAGSLVRTLRANQQEGDQQTQLRQNQEQIDRQKQQQTFSQGMDANRLSLDKNYLDFQINQAQNKMRQTEKLGQAAMADLTERWQNATDPAEKADIAARIKYVASGGDPNRALMGIKSPTPAKPKEPPRLSFDTEYEGDKAFRVGRDPYTGAERSRAGAGTLKPSAEALKADREARMAAGIAQGLPELASKIDANDSGKMASQAKLYSLSGNPIEFYAASKLIGPVDNNYAMLFSQIGQLDAALTRAYTGGRISAQVYKRLHPHFPAPGDPPELLADKVKSLLGPKGVLQQEHAAISQLAGGEVGGPMDISSGGGAAPAGGGSEGSPSPSRPVAAPEVGRPVYAPNGKLLGHTFDGKTMVPAD